MDTFNTIMTISRIVVISMGLIGHVLSFIIFSRPVFQKNSISTYCRALAVSECFIIYELVGDIGLFYNFVYPVYSDAGCKLYYYISMAFGSIPGWILIAFSIDKVLSMKKIATKILNRRSFQYGIILAIVLLNLLVYIEIPIFINLFKITFMGVTYVSCDTSTNKEIGSFIIYLYLIEGSILPFLFMFASSIIMIRMIRNSTKNFNRRNSRVSRRTTRDIKFAITSVAFNVLFVGLKLPLVLMLVLSRYYPNLNAVGAAVAFLLYFLNYSISFFVHLVSNSLFRREIFIMLTIRKSNTVESIGHSTLATTRQTINKLPSVH